MAKKKSTDESPADGAAKKKPAAKKTAAARPAKKAAAAPKKSRAKKDTAIDTAPVSEAAEIIDAEIIAEIPAEPPVAFSPVEAVEEVEPAPELSDEEKELSAIYGDVSAPASAHGEFQDQKTRDEDRPMMPEINAREERKNMWQDRRDQRKRRQEERRQRREQGGQRPGGGGGGGGGGEHRAHDQQGRPEHHRPNEHRPGEHREPRPHQQQAQGQAHEPRRFEMPVNGHSHEDTDVLGRVGTPLGDAAATVFAQLRNGQPLPVRQLAAMMRKRSLVNQDPEQLWPQLKAELLGDERSYRTLGLRPRIVYRGRDLFAPGPVAMSQTAEAEAGVANALSKLASATHTALAHRLRRASPQGFERIIHAYLVAAGYREIEWVKRVGGIAYASATAPGISRTILLSARSGDQPIDRRGIGELRVGVEAKDLVAGILFSPTDLSEDAERELERAGRSISVVCGDQLVATLINAGVGVVSSAAPLHYLDDQLLDEILAG